MMRRIVFVGAAFVTQNKTYQLLALFYINMFTLIYIGKIKPLYIIVRNKIELFNELCISIASIFMLIFTDWVPDLENHYKAGWGMCGIICLNIIVNNYFILKLGIYNLWLLY